MDDIDLIVYNHAIHTALLGDTLSEIQVPAKNTTTLREAAKSAETWRNTKGYPDMAFAKAKLLDLPDWQKDFGKAECFFSVLVDQLVFHKGFDSALRQGLKLNKGAADLLSYGAVGAEVQKIHDLVIGANKEDGGHKREEHMQDPTGGQEGNNTAGEENTAMDEEDGEFLDEDQAEQRSRWTVFANTLVN